MQIVVDEIFFKDLNKIKNKSLYKKVDDTIEEIKKAGVLSEIKNLKKLTAGKTNDYNRLRIADYRIGIRFINSQIVFVRILHRKEIYRYFLSYLIINIPTANNHSTPGNNDCTSIILSL